MSQYQNTEGNSTPFVSNPPTNYTSLSIKKNEIDTKVKSPPIIEMATDEDMVGDREK